MPEAVIVATARSPIGRAGKGSLVGIRPDDLAAQMVRAALDKVPAIDPHSAELAAAGGPAGSHVPRATRPVTAPVSAAVRARVTHPMKGR